MVARSHTQSRFIRALSAAAAVIIACVAILYLTIPMNVPEQEKFDVILVLGNPAKSDGSIGPLARSRVLKGIEQYRAGVAPVLLLTGGAVANQFVEANVMRNFAVSQGVPPDAVFAEGQARNTIQNAWYSWKIMQAHRWNSAVVVSSPSHLRRARLIFNHYPFACRLESAPWPQNYPLWKRIWTWSSEAAYTAYARIFGFPNAGQFLPGAHA
jgi:uncharacterized SAM-binding protein YcdF (DUF218 family)